MTLLTSPQTPQQVASDMACHRLPIWAPLAAHPHMPAHQQHPEKERMRERRLGKSKKCLAMIKHFHQ